MKPRIRIKSEVSKDDEISSTNSVISQATRIDPAGTIAIKTSDIKLFSKKEVTAETTIKIAKKTKILVKFIISKKMTYGWDGSSK